MKRWVLLVVAVLLLGGCGSALVAGECVITDELEEGESEVAVSSADCEDEAATHEVLQVVDRSDACVEVAGVTRVLKESDEEVLCLGDRGADHAAGANVAVVGDCLDDGELPARVPCDGPEATYEVVGRFVAVPQLEAQAPAGDPIGPDSPCSGIDDWNESIYAWSLPASALMLSVENVDVLLCLGDV